MKLTKLLTILTTGMSSITYHSSAQVKKVFAEEWTSVYCGWCPFGALGMDSILLRYPGKIVPVAMHDFPDTNFTFSDAKTTESGLKLVAMPSFSFDRRYMPADWRTYEGLYRNGNGMPQFDLYPYVDTQLVVKAPCAVTITNVSYNSTTQMATVTVNANFTRNVSGDIRLNLVLTEDSIMDHNEQRNDANGVAGPFLLKGNPFFDWYQNHVCRLMAGGAWGTAGVIPSVVTAGSNYSQTYSIKIASKYNLHFLNLIGIVQKYDTLYSHRDILNCESAKLDSFLTTGIANAALENSIVNIYPNPASENCSITILLNKPSKTTVEVFNSIGEKVVSVFDKELSSGNHSIYWNVNIPNGVYFIVTRANDIKMVNKLVVNK